MLLRQVWLPIVLLLAGALSGRAQNTAQPSKNLTCYYGTQRYPVALTADFPNGYNSTCQSDGSYYNKTCAEYRLKNWETEVGAAQIYMFCGDCRNAEHAGMECRQCDTDLCNDKWARELLPIVSEMRHCYLSRLVGTTVLPEAVLCPKNQSCVTSAEPGYYTTVGCETHCKKFNWSNCEYCTTVLCNSLSDVFEIPVDHIQLSEPANKTKVTASDQAVCVSSPVARQTAQVAVLAVVAALALRRLQL